MDFSSFSPDSLIDPDALAQRLADWDMHWACPPRYMENTLPDADAHDLTKEYSPFCGAPFLGNGELGMMLWQTQEGLRLEVNSSRAYDARQDGTALYGRNRLRNGYYLLSFVGAPTQRWDLRLELWNALLRGTVTTSAGAIGIQAYSHARLPVQILELSFSGREETLPQFHSLSAESTRPILWLQPDQRIGDYPPAQTMERDGISYCVRRLTNLTAGTENPDPAKEGRSVNAWCCIPLPGRRLRMVSTFLFLPHQPDTEAAIAQAQDLIRRALALSPEELLRQHQLWWHQRYLRSAVYLPDGVLESFYWIQMYKLFSSVREDGSLLDLFGPWFKPSGWIAVWANLNVQMAYSPLPMAGHGDLCKSLIRWLAPEQLLSCAQKPGILPGSMALPTVSLPDQIDTPVEKPEGLLAVRSTIGNLPYCLINLWDLYQTSMDSQLLEDTLFPLLKGALLYYRSYLYPGSDGKEHLPFTWSPEWGVNTEDSNFDLALLRWCCKTLLDIQPRLHTQDPIFSAAEDTLQRLTPPPQDSCHGLYVGKNEPYHHSHRHWSHLFSIYPCRELQWSNPEHRGLIESSLRQFMSYQELYTGFSWVAIASLFAACGNGEQAVSSLYRLLDAPYLWPNTMYTEMGDRAWPTIETPLGVNRSIQEMLLQDQGALTVFPAVPESWKDIGFFRLMAHGAFAVSAARFGGLTRWICIESCAGGSCSLQLPEEWNPEELSVYPGTRHPVVKDSRILFFQHLDPGEWILLRQPGWEHIQLPHPQGAAIHWGSHKPLFSNVSP